MGATLVPRDRATVGVLLTDTHFGFLNGAPWRSVGITTGSIAAAAEVGRRSANKVPRCITTRGVGGADTIHNVRIDTSGASVVQTAGALTGSTVSRAGVASLFLLTHPVSTTSRLAFRAGSESHTLFSPLVCATLRGTEKVTNAQFNLVVFTSRGVMSLTTLPITGTTLMSIHDA